MSLIILKDIDGDDLGIDPYRIELIEAYQPGNKELAQITILLGRGSDSKIIERVVRHSVAEIVEAINKVEKFGY